MLRRKTKTPEFVGFRAEVIFRDNFSGNLEFEYVNKPNLQELENFFDLIDNPQTRDETLEGIIYQNTTFVDVLLWEHTPDGEIHELEKYQPEIGFPLLQKE